MALTAHTGPTRIYGQVFGTPPFQNASGAATFTNVKPYPAAPAAYIPTTGVGIWPLANGVLVGNTYVYSILELPAAGLNQPTVKLATDQAASVIAAAAT